MKKVHVVACSLLLLCSLLGQAQQTISTATDAVVPPLVNFGGVLTDLSNKPLSGVTGVTFSLYKEQQGGSPVWMETQNVQPDETGHYTVMLGSTTSTGLPSSLFATGAAHWLGVRVEGQEEQARVLLVSAPYALKAVDAETVGGLPASAFMLAAPASKSENAVAAPNASATSAAAPPPATVTGSGTTDYIPKWTSTSAIGNSALYQLGSGSTTKIGVNTTTPGEMLDVRGTGRFLVSTTLNAFVGNQNGTGTAGNGVVGLSSSTNGYGVYGFANSTTTLTTAEPIGVYGTVASARGIGVYGSGGFGVVGISNLVVSGADQAGPGGYFTGMSAPTGSNFFGAYGVSGFGGRGDPNAQQRVGGTGVYGVGGEGSPYDEGYGTVDGPGGIFYGADNSPAGGDGVDAFGGSGAGVVAYGGDEVETGDGIDAYAGTDLAGNFIGNVEISGTLNGGTPAMKIDHPLDPANQYLSHASVESSEMVNIYTGNITTDSAGNATVQLPKWFGAMNADFRYQLTSIGQFSQAIVASEIEKNQFSIRTDKPNVKVSWQVTGVRQDAYAKAHPLVVEQQKSARVRGFYIHPELYGAPANRQIEWARHPEHMKRATEGRAKARLAAKAAAQLAASVPAK
jgi:hypothetical protein